MMSVLCLCDKHRQYYSRLLSFTNIVSESSEWNSGKMERERERDSFTQRELAGMHLRLAPAFALQFVKQNLMPSTREEGVGHGEEVGRQRG